MQTKKSTFVGGLGVILFSFYIYQCDNINNVIVDHDAYLTQKANNDMESLESSSARIKEEEITNPEDDVVLKLLQNSKVENIDDVLPKLPSSAQVISLYGSKPKIIGLETCSTFRNQVPPEHAWIGIAGMFNSGTNLMAKLFDDHCLLPSEEKTGLKGSFPVPWNKHSPAKYKDGILAIKRGHPDADHPRFDTVLPVVVIKDPYNWMQSMCRHYYKDVRGYRTTYCPTLMDNSGSTFQVRVQHLATIRSLDDKYKNSMAQNSLLDYWNDWNSQYYQSNNSSYPRLMIRYEDLLFHVDKILPKVCECAGGTVIGEPHIPVKTAKNQAGANGLIQAIIENGTPEKRIGSMRPSDLVYARQTLSSELLDTFGYKRSTKF